MKVRNKRLKSTAVIILILPFINLFFQEAKAHQKQPQKLVEKVDMERFMGTWYEIARFPNFFQNDQSVGGSDTYEKLANGEYQVTYSWQEKNFGQAVQKMKGKFWIDNPEVMGQMKVQFLWPFAADYWLIDLDKNYNYIVVGYPDRSMLWILSKEKTLSEEVYQQILRNLKEQQYDISKLIKVPQNISLSDFK